MEKVGFEVTTNEITVFSDFTLSGTLKQVVCSEVYTINVGVQLKYTVLAGHPGSLGFPLIHTHTLYH